METTILLLVAVAMPLAMVLAEEVVVAAAACSLKLLNTLRQIRKPSLAML